MWINRRSFDALLAAHEREVQGLREAAHSARLSHTADRDILIATQQREVQGLRAEAASLREMLAAASDHNRRMARVDRSLTELEPRRKEPQPEEHMPPAVQRIVALYDSQQAREIIGTSIRAARGRGESWDQIEAALKADLPESIIQKLEVANG